MSSPVSSPTTLAAPNTAPRRATGRQEGKKGSGRGRRYLRPGPQGFWVNEVGRGGPRPFCPLSQLFWLVFFLPLSLLPFFVCPPPLLRRTVIAQPMTEMSCPVPVWVRMKKGPARDATVVVPWTRASFLLPPGSKMLVGGLMASSAH